MQLRSGYASLTVRARSILQALIALSVTFILVGSTLAMGTDERAAHLSHAAEHTDWPFKHVVIDAAPLATFRINDLQIGDINGDGLRDIWTSGRGAGADAYQMVWYKNPNWERYEIAPGDFKYGDLGDLDGDGDLDIVAGKEWFENTGQPEQRDWPRYPLGYTLEPDIIRTGDLNGDGRLDIVLTTKRRMFWLPGPEDPRQPWPSILLGQEPGRTGLSLGDVDGDGDLDVVWGNAWYENPGEPAAGNWMRTIIDPEWPKEARSVIADMNGDGRPDVVLSGEESAHGVAWYEAPGGDPRSAGWTRHDVVREGYEGVHTLEAADFDQDGDLDIFAAEMHHGADPDQVTIFENVNGDGTQWEAHVFDDIGSHNAKVADLNGDGFPDLAGKNYEAGALPLQVDVWINRLPTAGGEGLLALDRWQRHIIDENRPWQAVFITGGDINGDDLPDIITGGWWYENPGSASGDWDRHDIGGELYNMAVVYDFDRDGDLDILGTKGQPNSSEFLWAENDGAGSFTLHANLPPAEGDFLQGAAVIPAENGAGPKVVLSWHNRTGTQLYHVPDPPTGDWTFEVITPETTGEAVAVSDLDGDGDTDIHLGTFWLRADGDTWARVEAVTLGDPEADPDRVELADINGDGRLDVVIGAEHANRVVWGEAPENPNDPWVEHLISDQYLAMSLDVGDLDDDGDLDVVIGEHIDQTGRTVILANDGQGQAWTEYVIDSAFEHHVGTQLIDIDNDGDLDILSIGWRQNQVALFENLAISQDGPAATATPTDAPAEEPTPTTEATEAATPPAEPTALPSDPAAVRVTDGLQAFYTFNEGRGATVRDMSGNETVLDLTIRDTANVTWTANGLTVSQPTLIISGAAPTRLIDALRATNAITLEAWIKPANLTQEGPARILTLSESELARNFTLGQGDWHQQPSDFIDVRLRTTETSENGSPSLASAQGTLGTEITHVVYTRSADGTARLYIDGQEQASGQVLGDFSTWGADFQLALANEISGDRPWLGDYYLVAVYDRALSAEEVAQNRQAGPGA